MMQVNRDLCLDPECADNDALRDPVRTRHHHTEVNVRSKHERFSETHGGPMSTCGVIECKQVYALYSGSPSDEKVTGVQEDLVKQAAEIAEWWVKTAQADAERTVPKAVEYGAVDFDSMGLAMVALVRDKFIGADDAELMKVGREMAAMFYLNGKIGRALGAFQQGMLPSDDTIFDIGVYAMMWRRIRETGDWIK